MDMCRLRFQNERKNDIVYIIVFMRLNNFFCYICMILNFEMKENKYNIIT